MNFIEAVTALKNGLCEEIRPVGGCATYILHSDGVLRFKVDLCLPLREATDYLGDWVMVNPKPQFETVEVKRWYRMESGQYYDTEPKFEPDAYIELTGTFQKEVKPK